MLMRTSCLVRIAANRCVKFAQMGRAPLIFYKATVFGFLLSACIVWPQAQAQDSAAPSSNGSSKSSPTTITRRAETTSVDQIIALTVPVGLAIQIVLDKEMRLQKVGQPLQGHVVEPIYAFDK